MKKNEEKIENKKRGKFIIPTIAIIIIILIAIIVFLILKLNNTSINDNSNIQSNSSNISNNNQKNNTNSQLKNISFKSMEVTDNNLTDDQKTIAKFFDKDYFEIYSYEEIVRYADMLKNINLNMYCVVDSILSSDNENFEALCNWKIDFEDIENNNDLIIIKGKKPSEMIIKDDAINVRGKLIGAETRTINGESKYVPIIEVAEIGEGTLWYDDDTIRQVAKTVFGNNIKVRTPTNEEIDKMVSSNYYTYQNHLMIVEMENQSNMDFKTFDIWKSELGLITYNMIYNQGITDKIQTDDKTTLYLNKSLYVTPDLQKYIVFDYSAQDKYIYIKIYDRNLNKLWQREIANVSQITWDATNSNLVFISDNDFYNINMETGEDIFKPVYVGKRRDVRIVDNGYIVLGNDTDDGIMFVDNNGNITNKYDLINDGNSNVIYTTAIQKIDNNYIILYTLTDENYYYSSVKSKYIILDENGNKINENK